jgi:hypothetical protein
VMGPGSGTAGGDGEAIVTATGPLTSDHVALSFAPSGSPSSVALPVSVVSIVGAVRVWSGPTLTTGGVLTYVALTESLAAVVVKPSFTSNCKRYVPGAKNWAVVVRALGAENVTAAGPESEVHANASVRPGTPPVTVAT